MSTYRNLINEMYLDGFSPAEDEPTFRVPENFDRYNEGSGWQAYQGGNDWEQGTTGVAVYLNPEGYNKEMARIWFEVKYPPHLAEYVSSEKGYGTPSAREVKKWGQKASRRWIRETARIHKETKKVHGPHDGYQNYWKQYRPWKECFVLALQSERMKPFVKKFGVDKTKWVGLKRSQPLNESLQEAGLASKFWWMDPDAQLIPVANQGHAQKGGDILNQKFGVVIKQVKDAYPELYKRGYVRVGFAGMLGQYFLEVTYNKSRPPSLKQWQALKDLAVETGAEVINDEPMRRNIRVDECRLLFENFHENKEWFIYEGAETLTAVFDDNSRQTFKVHFHEKRLREDREKVRKKAAGVWKRLAMEIRKSAGLSKVGNPVIIPWQECFEQALKDPQLQEYVDDMRAVPIFEAWLPMQNIWLAPDGTPKRVGSHERGASEILAQLGKKIEAGYKAGYDALYRLGYARVVVGDNAYPLIIDTGADVTPRLTKAQRQWAEEKSTDLGLSGEYSNAYGRSLYLEGSLNEMTYDELHQSMRDYKTRADIRKGTTTGSDNRDRGAKEVNVRSLRVISSVGKDGTEHETSMFSYKSRSGNAMTPKQRWQGYIRFIENAKGGAVVPVKDDQDVEVNCTCFAGDTLVLMGDGHYKPIKDIGHGDFVYTHKGRIRPVIGNVARIPAKDENVYKLGISGFPTDIIVTGNHPFYTLRGNTMCRCGCGTPLVTQSFESLSPEFVLARKYTKNHQPNRNWIKEIRLLPDENPFQWVKVNDLKKHEWFLSPWIEEGNGSLDPNLARFLGYYAAEGNIPNRDDVRFCFHLSEMETLGKDSIRIAESLYNKGLHFRLPHPWKKTQGNIWKIYRMDGPTNTRKQKCFGITFHITKEFKSFIKDNIGCGSHEKKLSPWLMSLNNDTLKQFIVGLFLGDGTIKPNGHFRWSSVSHHLIHNVSTILRKLKVNHVITNAGEHMAIDVYHADSARQIYDWLTPYLRTSMLARKSNRKDRKEFHREEGALKTLRSINKIDYDQSVWDLCVEEDHSFIVAGIAVANCHDYKYVWAKANSDVDAGDTGKTTTAGFSHSGPVSKVEPKQIQYKDQGAKPVNIFEAGEVAPIQDAPNVDIDKRWKFQGGNTNNGTYGKRIRNPNNVPGLCKHLIALAEYIEKKTASPVAPAEPGKEEPSAVAPSKLKKTGKPVNIFESIKQFALQNPSFDVPYED